MDDTKRCITVLHRIHNNPHGKQVVNLIQGLLLIHHFFVNAEEVLCTPINLGTYPGRIDMLTDFLYNIVHYSLTRLFFQRNLFHQVIVDLRLQILQRQIIQLDFDLGNTKPVRDRRIDIHRLTGLLFLFLRRPVLCCAHIVETVCQLDKDDPDILCHRKEHFPQIFCLYLDLIR